MSEVSIAIPNDINMEVNEIRERANSLLDESLRGKLGQFMSSSSVSNLLASMFEDLSGDIRLLDAGAGVGSLTAAFVSRAAISANSISATAYEIDDVMASHLGQTLELCGELLNEFNVDWSPNILRQDFIKEAVSALTTADFVPSFNKAILNPPYLKIAAKGPERAEIKKVKFETGNLYSAFVGLAVKLLEEGGELVAITPRSFCNGPYFNDFRKLILDECSLNKIHVFNSRKSAFKADKVLQENVVFHLTKGKKQVESVTVYSSSCAEDPNPEVFEVPFSDVVSPNNPDRFIHIITNEKEQKVAHAAGGLPCSLEDLGIQASTGRVVDFRTRENLVQDTCEHSVPLIFPQHLQNGGVEWPITGSKKPNSLLHNESTEKLMVPNGTYVLTRRLTAKEEKRRIAASLYTANIADVPVVGFENKTNYFHANNMPLEDDLAKGLWIFLNSTLVDQYFRQMNGHTQVNATDLRTLRYPNKDKLKELAKLYSSEPKLNQLEIDDLVLKIIK
ncbi:MULTISPECIES: Eco57I restriction-modification methylase domain-containing protein [Vibrio harveyi group]|uniref:Eco57I restriction-modification methylase domain-containing protein n=1 Tax=Vibrio harveyi group TaxID=717610 RepID=UPI00215BB59A|nr:MULTISPECIES: Eco57I restriction-modification methylase domain-containing protein [Vibrio harveyi group]MCR9560471.1 Eco57I restriction-modification methylase domain-containing protein [Vibrio alginolyticus]MCS0387313.1 Eco57I restriction-modification methylase domain-containing protein [Vibrio diabolicus]